MEEIFCEEQSKKRKQSAVGASLREYICRCLCAVRHFKMTYDPLRTRVEWNDEVGTVYTDLSYGQGSANKFDLYVPADNTKGTYGLVVYLHAGGFTAGDKSGDAEILKWLCARGYVAAGVNYTLFGEENPQASIYTQSLESGTASPPSRRKRSSWAIRWTGWP